MKDFRMNIKSAVYIDANGNEYPLKVDGFYFYSAEELMLKLEVCQHIDPEDTISIRIFNNNAEIGKGDPIGDKDDVTYAHCDADGNVMLSGHGG